MTLEDGREIHCCENHIWRVKDRRYNKIKDLTIKELLPIYKKPRIHNGYSDKVTRRLDECFFAIPNNSPIEYPHTELPIRPYFLGLWLGDGNSRNLAITTTDKEIVEEIHSYANELGYSVREDNLSYHITTGKSSGSPRRNILRNRFNSLFQNKHIPKEFIYTSFENRLALLQGLMDTDGIS